MKLPVFLAQRPLGTKTVGVVLVLAVLVAGAVLGVRELRDLPDDAAFEYDGTVVTKDDLDERVEVLGALYGIKEPGKKDGRAAFRRDTAKAVAVSMVLDDAARDKGVAVSDKRARDTLDQMVASQLGADPREAFTELLADFGVTEAAVLDEVKRQQAVALLFEKITKDAAADVTAADARDYYEAHPDRFMTPEGRELRNIVVRTDKDAQVVVQRARKGEDFAALARANSLDDATRDQGGALGVVPASSLAGDYAKAAFGARSGAVFGPVRTQFGWNVGQVVRIVPGKEPTFDQVEDQALDVVRSERALETWRDWLEGRIKKADVEYADSYRPEDPNEPPAVATEQP